MIPEYFENIELKNSTLLKRVYRSESQLRMHLKHHLREAESVIVVFKFKKHCPDITEVLLALEQLNNFYIQVPESQRGATKLKVIRILEQDWFVEVCAGVTAVTAITNIIYTIWRDHKMNNAHKREEYFEEELEEIEIYYPDGKIKKITKKKIKQSSKKL